MLRNIIRNPRKFVAFRWNMVISNLFYPDKFYDDYVSKHGLMLEVILVLLLGAIGSIGIYYGVQEILSEFALGASGQALEQSKPGMDRTTARQLRARTVYPVLGIFLVWLYYTTAYYVGAWLFSGHGTYFQLLKNTAWSLVPFAFANLALTIGFVLTYSGLEINTSLPGLPERNVAFLLGQGYSELPLILVPLVTIAVVAWVTYIGASGIQDAMQLSRARALQIAAAPAVLHALYLLSEALGRMGVV